MLLWREIPLQKGTVSQGKKQQDRQWIWKSLRVLSEAWPRTQQLPPPESCWGQNSNNTKANIRELQRDSFQTQPTPLQGRTRLKQLGSETEKLREKRSSKYRRTPKRKLSTGKVKKSQFRASWDLWLPREQKSLPLLSSRPWAPQQEWQWLLQAKSWKRKKSRKRASVLSKNILGIFKVETGAQHSTLFHSIATWSCSLQVTYSQGSAGQGFI